MAQTNELRVLFVEDLPSDALLAERVIRKSGLEFSSQRVETKDAFLEALEGFRPDIIVSDYSMPGFDGMQALLLLLERDSTIPFILLTGSVNEDTAVACMKAGAWDYVIKERMSRLPFAVKEALEQKKVRIARDEAERALRESEERLRTFVDSATDLVFLKDSECRYLLVNSANQKFLGKSESDILGKTDFDLMPQEMANACHQSDLEAVEHNEIVVSFEQANDRIYESRKFPVHQKDGKVGVGGFIRDVTDRQRAEKEIALLAHTLRSISECVSVTDLNDKVLFVNAAFLRTYGYAEQEILGKNIRVVGSPNNRPEIVKEINAATLKGGWNGEMLNRARDGREFPVSLSTSFVKDESGQPIALVGVATDITERKQTEAKVARALEWQEAIFEGSRDAIFVSDAESLLVSVNLASCRLTGYTKEELLQMRIPDLHQAEDLEAYLKFHDQIMAGEELVTEAKLWQKNGQKVDVEFSNKRIVIDGVSYMHTTARDVSERRRAEEALRLESAALEAAANAIVITDRDGIIEWVNPAFVTLTGYLQQEAIGKNPRDLVKSGKHDGVFYKDLWDKILAGETWRGQLINRRKDGSFYTEEQTITPLRDVNGKISHFIAIKEDITERKRVEEALAESEKKFKWLFDQAPVLYHVLSPEGIVTDINVRWCEILGYSKEEVLGKPIFDFILESERSSAKSVFAAKREKIASIRSRNERNYVAKDGTVRAFLVGDNMTRDSQGKLTSIQTTMEDITDRKRAEEALRASKAMIDRIINAIPVRVFWKDKNLTYLGCNAIFAHDAGYAAPEDVIGKDDYQMAWRDQAELYRADDRNVIDSDSPRLLIVESQTTPGGETMTLLTSKLPLLDDQEEVIGVLGTYMDVTERKNAENDLRLSEERFRSVWDNSADGMRLTDREGRIIDVNPAFRKLVRKSREELLGKIFSIAYQSQGPDDDLTEYHRRFDAGETLLDLLASAELWNGETVALHVSSSYIETAGQERLLLALFRDVTDQEEAEKRLEEERTLLRTVIDAIPDEIGVKDLERRFLTVNAGTLKAFKLARPEEMIGKRDEDFVPEPLASVAKEEEEILLAEGGKMIGRIGEKVNPVTGEILRSILITKIPLKDGAGKTSGLVVVNRDITEVQRANASLEKERQLLLTLIESIPDEICLKDTAHRFVVANSATVKAIGARSMEDLLGKTDADFAPSGLAREHSEEEDKILASGKPIINLERIRRDPITGKIEKCLLSTKVPVRDKNGATLGILVINRYITERKRTEEELKASEERLRILFEYAPDAYYLMNLQGLFVDGNKAAEELSGYAREELIGKSFSVLGLMKQETLQRASVLLGKNAQGHPSGPDEFEMFRKDGSQVEVEIRTYPVTINNEVLVLGIARDVSQRKQSEEALRASEEKFRALFEESKDAVYFSTVDGRLLDINPAGVDLLGYGSKEELLQIDLARDGYADAKEKKRFDRQMEADGFVRDFEVTLKRKDGGKLTVLETAVAVRDRVGKIVQYRGSMRDVTKQRQLEAQFLQAQKMESIGTLAGGIAHDFNNILGIVLGHVALMERSRNNLTQFEESSFSINKAVERGASLVRQILTFARKAETQLEPVNINSTIKELSKMLEETFPKTIEITQKLDKTIPIISMDPTQLHQTLLNLCVNARDAMNGVGTIAISTHLELGSGLSTRFPRATAQHYIQVTVKDTGIGISEEMRQRIFEPFFTTKEKGKGTGLGLAVVYGVLESHHGFIDVESAPGAGTAFHLFFPVPEGILTTGVKQKASQGELPRGTETILVVEDEDVLRDLLVKMLEMQGYKVIPASDGDEAVMRFSERAKEIDLVMSDMGLPKQSGWDAFRMMRKLNPKVRALLASGYIEPSQKSEILKSGVMRFINKPYKMEEVLTAIRETLDDKKSRH